MVPEIIVVVLACARIGAVHNVVFGGFSGESIQDRVNDSSSKILVTQDLGVRGEKYNIPMFENALSTKENCLSLEKLIVFRRIGDESVCKKVESLDFCVFYEDEMNKVTAECPCEEMDSEAPLFILYTSGSTGKPKGMYHTVGGYTA